MRLTSSEWLRIGLLAAVSLLVVAIIVFQSGDDDDPVASSTPTSTVVPAGPSAADQVSQADAGAADEEPVDTGPAVVQRGEQTFTGALTGPVQFGTASEENEIPFSVAVEDGIGVRATELATIVDTVLSDPRSWAASAEHSLVRVPDGGVFQLVVTSPDTTDDLCAPLQTIGQLSCALDGVVAINLERWLTGSRGWEGSLEDYRAWVINHEVGHQLGLMHRPCPEPGAVAPVMQQQSIDLDGCEPNPWPYPAGAPPAVDDPDSEPGDGDGDGDEPGGDDLGDGDEIDGDGTDGGDGTVEADPTG